LPPNKGDREAEIWQAAGCDGPQRIEVPGQIVERTSDQIVAGIFSLSSSTPYLFGERRHAFEVDLRRLLQEANPTGIFSEQMRKLLPTSGGRAMIESGWRHSSIRGTIMRQFLYGIGLLMAAALLVWIDRSPSDVANQVSLLMVLIGAGLLGIAAPRWAWLSALLLGACLAAAHAVYLMAGIALPYAMSPTGWAGPATLLILIIPAGCAAYLGAGAATLIRRRQRPRALS
jgi:hypothetical protein